MSVNVSSTPSSLLLDQCVSIIITFYVIRAILLLPLSTFILFLGFQKWRQQHSLKTASHSDHFTYHLAVMELMWVIGLFCTFIIKYIETLGLVGGFLTSIALYGEMLFHVLTCVERYLAVVHPIIYMRLKNARGVRIRNISIGCVWVLCFALTSFNFFIKHKKPIEFFCLLAVSITVTCYCSISVLCVIIRPVPGGGTKEKERVDQSKQRAFNTIVAILTALLFWFGGYLVSIVLGGFGLLNSDVSCVVTMILSFLNLPSYLVSPLLYLHRAGKLNLTCCSRK